MRRAIKISTGAFHYLRLTVTDLARDFYTGVLNFRVARGLPSGVLLCNGGTLLGLLPTLDPTGRADRFKEPRVGLDHLGLGVDRREKLERAACAFERGMLAFRDPDNIQLELTALAG